MSAPKSQGQHPLESMDSMQRRRFLGLAAFAATTVVGVGVTGAGPAAAEPAMAPEQLGVTYDADTGWPIFDGPRPPAGYSRHHLPCDEKQYVDVPDEAVAAATHEALEVVHAPYPDFTAEAVR